MNTKSKKKKGGQSPCYHKENNVYVNSHVNKFYDHSVNIENFHFPFTRPMPNEFDITDVDYEEVDPAAEPASTVVEEDDKIKSDDQVEEVEQLRVYLGQLRELATAAYQVKFDDVIQMLLDDPKVLAWLLDARRCKQFKLFNKYKVYKLCRMLMNAKVIHFDNGNCLDFVLEPSAQNTSYRRTMNKSEDEDLLIEQQIKSFFIQKK